MNSQTNQRKTVFINARLQGRMCAALIALEVGMLLIALIYLYVHFNAIIESQLYLAHSPLDEDNTAAFIQTLGKIVLIMALVNSAALLGAHYLWRHHTQKIVNAFRQRLTRLQQLDFRRPGADEHALHDVLTQLTRWQQIEASRVMRIRAVIDQLTAQQAPLTAARRAQIQRKLLLAKEQLLENTPQ